MRTKVVGDKHDGGASKTIKLPEMLSVILDRRLCEMRYVADS